MAYPVTLNGRTYTLADFEGQNYVDGLPDAFEDFVTHAGNLYSTTSTTSNTIGTGSKTFTVESSKPYQVGTPLRITDSAAPSTNWIDAIVTAYSGTTLTVDAVAYAGSGTKTSWNINIGGGGTSYTGTLPVAQGGTGATTAAAARTNLDVYSKADADSRFLNVSGEASDITITGDVGIGGAPDTALHVQGSTAPVILRVEGTDAGAGDGPRLELYRNSASPANDDDIGQIYFSGEDDGGGKHQYAKIEAFVEDASAGSEDGRLNFNVLSGGSGSQMLTLRADTGGTDGEVVVNEPGDVVNFRIEGDTEPNLFVTNASNDTILIGRDASQGVASSTGPRIQASGTTGVDSAMSITRYQSNSNGPIFILGKSRSDTLGGTTIVNDNDELGRIEWAGADGTDLRTVGAEIVALVDGTPGANDLPTRLVLKTTPDGANTPTTKMTITSDGLVGLGDQTPSYELDIRKDGGSAAVDARIKNDGTNSADNTIMRFQIGGTTANNYIFFGDSGDSNAGEIRYSHNDDFLSIDVNAAERLRINSSGYLGVGTSDPKGYVHALKVGNGNQPNFLSTGAGNSDLDYAVDHDEVMQFGGWNRVTDTVDAVRVSLETNGDMTIEDGNLKLANGHGINFAATPGTGESELFNDYEEGTFTPTSLTNSGNAASFGSVHGYYTKIGRMVFFDVNILNIDTSGTTGSSQVRIGGFPFTIDVATTRAVCTLDNISFQGSRTQATMTISTSEYANIAHFGGGNTDTTIDYNDIDGATADILFSGFYFTSE